MIDKITDQIQKEYQASSKSNIVVCGPTCSGKSSIAMILAKKMNGEIIGCDSVQLYKGFDIGSAKPSLKDQEEIPHHLYDVVDSTQDWDAALYVQEAKKNIQSIKANDKTPILVGGTGLYLRAFLGINWHDLPYDPKVREKYQNQSVKDLREQLDQIDPLRSSQILANDHLRLVRALELCELLKTQVSKVFEEQKKSALEYLNKESFIIKVVPDKSVVDQRIVSRVDQMFAQGLIQEVEQLISNGVKGDSKPMKSIGYKEVCSWLDQGKLLSEEALKEKIVISTRQYAKRQLTWFAKVEGHFVVKNCV